VSVADFVASDTFTVAAQSVVDEACTAIGAERFVEGETDREDVERVGWPMNSTGGLVPFAVDPLRPEHAEGDGRLLGTLLARELSRYAAQNPNALFLGGERRPVVCRRDDKRHYIVIAYVKKVPT
jgi:hypothetical protein